ncbi:hypothetical protein F6X40_24175 [Paraburkholderia sp. UCT31]|uniref:hypothetical protein n=1 Tax=Paraburkholderia sp. UCT31 TaxID=2615209 RepID=UPI001CA39CBE|nr:hypothetical protein [Paraburkholderia sp. UCT31]MBC8739815.1 hypothetical protein [Paraburkholderia sp. UCT31]
MAHFMTNVSRLPFPLVAVFFPPLLCHTLGFLVGLPRLLDLLPRLLSGLFRSLPRLLQLCAVGLRGLHVPGLIVTAHLLAQLLRLLLVAACRLDCARRLLAVLTVLLPVLTNASAARLSGHGTPPCRVACTRRAGGRRRCGRGRRDLRESASRKKGSGERYHKL